MSRVSFPPICYSRLDGVSWIVSTKTARHVKLLHDNKNITEVCHAFLNKPDVGFVNVQCRLE